jgi:hypothetical protein
MITAGTYGAPNWVDLATTDVEAAVGFYQGLLGWKVEKTDSPMGDYYIGKSGQHQVGGMMAIPPYDAMVPMWTTFVYVEDVDAIVERVATAGGSVLEKPFDLPEGRVAVVADPSGGMFGVISGPRPEGTWISREPGSVCWVELLTRDTIAAENFYAHVFAWKAETQTYGDTSYTTFSQDGEPVAGMMSMPAEVPAEAPAHWAVYFAVADCSVSVAKAVELGGSILHPAQATAIGSFAVLEDPQGAVFQLMDYRP